ncbi:MAG: alpha-ketoacid dehydrogenase subunit beta, partial [Brevefilum sp.]
DGWGRGMNAQNSTTVLSSLNAGLHQALEDNSQVIILGEDILDPYGGSFKVTKGLSNSFPDRVMTTPISEAGITGIAGGMALRGMRPVVEIMFGDFSTLIVDQVVNHLAKFNTMYHQDVNVPVVIRTPMGGRRGYGPTHSQSLEKLFLGVPGLTVLAPFHFQGHHSGLGSPGQLLYDAVTQQDGPTFFIEHKLQYLLKLFTTEDLIEHSLIDLGTDDRFPLYKLVLKSAPSPQITLAAYGFMAHLAMEAMLILAYEHEIICELIVPTCLAPFKLGPLFDSAAGTGRLLTLEEGTLSLGWGAEVLARTAETLGPKLRAAGRLAAVESVIPAAPDLEDACLPDVADIVSRAREMVEENG